MAKSTDPIAQLQAEAAFARGVIDLVREHKMVRSRRYGPRKAKRKPRAEKPEAAPKPAKNSKSKKSGKRNPLAKVPAEQPE